MNSGVNASLRFAFTSKVEKGAFYNRKQVRKESIGGSHNRKGSLNQKGVYLSKGVCLSKGVKSKKGCLFIKRVFVLSKVSNQRKGVYEKRKRGMKKKQKENQNMSEEKGGYDNKTNTKTIKQILYQNKL